MYTGWILQYMMSQLFITVLLNYMLMFVPACAYTCVCVRKHTHIHTVISSYMRTRTHKQVYVCVLARKMCVLQVISFDLNIQCRIIAFVYML